MKRILVLHDLTMASRRTTRDHVYSFARYAPGDLHVFHHIRAPLTDALRSFPFDGVIMNYCFLGNRSSDFKTHQERYRFLESMPAVKIAIPQDDYCYNRVLDTWLRDLNVDVIYSPVQKNLEILYPENWGRAVFKEGLTAYTDSAARPEIEAFAKPFAERSIDVGTRVRLLPPDIGRYGQRKGESAIKFAEAAEKRGLRVDISTRPEDVLFGSRWLGFIGNCKFTLGSKGGSSLVDPDGSLPRAVRDYRAAHPSASFPEIEAACFPGQDNRYVFAGVSPRLFEAATLRTVQILIRDEYVGGIEPYVDYIPLDEDLSNLDEVFELMKDERACQDMAESCHRKLIASNAFDYSGFVADVLSQIPDSGRPWTEIEGAKLDEHFAVLEPFNRLREKFGGIWQASLGTNTVRLGRTQFAPIASELADWPAAFAASPGFIAKSVPAPPREAEWIATYSDFFNGVADDPEAAGYVKHLLRELSGSLAPETGAWTASPIAWWDMCEYVYEPAEA